VFADAIGFLDSDAPERTRCLVCDVTLPGIGGIDLLAHLEQRGLWIPTLFVSGRATAALRRRIDSTHALCLLEKPLDPSDLEHWIRHALARSQSPPDG
jgi:FixJ family two-component response regulator